MKLKKSLLLEADLSSVITSRTTLTYQDLIVAILNHQDEKITDSNIKSFETILKAKTDALKKYVELAKVNSFLNADGSVADAYKNTKPIVKDEHDNDSNQLVAGTFSKTLDYKEKAFATPQVTNQNAFSKQVFKMLTSMKGQMHNVKSALLLTGDPGVGKTSFIRNFSKLVGLPLITIEAPHITEEHIINIPFMVIIDNTVKKDVATVSPKKQGSLDSISADTFDVVNAESNLVSKIHAITAAGFKKTNEQLEDDILTNKNLRDVFSDHADLIYSVRSHFSCILFLDEFYRNDNKKIRNILRNILNGYIGNDKIPKGTYIVYASNLNDTGLSDIPMNHSFSEMKFEKVDKEQWFDYILEKYETDEYKKYENVKLSHIVFNKFYKELTDKDLSYDDADSDVRTSPRRWEQLLLYINENLPVSNVKQAKTLMTNVEVNFKNYTTNQVSDIYPKIKKIVIELIKETSNIEFDGSTNKESEWRDTLEQQILTKIRMDSEIGPDKEARKYVPIISGEPGIGKTSQSAIIANNLDLIPIHVDVSGLNKESTIGIIKSAQKIDNTGNLMFDKDGKPAMVTTFLKPDLLTTIENKMEEGLALERELPVEKRKKGKGKYKFLLLLDELTRTQPGVFNTIRRLLLEREFNEEYVLPEEIMVIGALNPEDEGAVELTKHMRDVLDIITAKASWKDTEEFLLSREVPPGLEKVLGFDCNSATVYAIKNLLSHFQSKDEDWRGNPVSIDDRLFNLRSEADIVYISPREIDVIVGEANVSISTRLTEVGIPTISNSVRSPESRNMSKEEFKAHKKNNTTKLIFDLQTRYSEEEYEKFIGAIIAELKNAWEDKASFECKKLQYNPDNFLAVTTGFILNNNLVRDMYEGIKTKQIAEIKSLGDILNAYFDDPNELLDSPHFDNYLTANFTNPQKFIQEITDFLADKITEIQRGDNTGTFTITNNDGEEHEIPKLADRTLDLYVRYMQYVSIILTILTEKTEYAGKVKEAERTGQYLSNLQMSLRMTSRSFLMDQGMDELFGENIHLLSKSKRDILDNVVPKIKATLVKFGLKG